MELTLLIQQYGNSMIYALDEGVLRVLCGAAVFLFPTYSAAPSEGTHPSCVGTSFSDELESCGACPDFSGGSELVAAVPGADGTAGDAAGVLRYSGYDTGACYHFVFMWKTSKKERKSIKKVSDFRKRRYCLSRKLIVE